MLKLNAIQRKAGSEMEFWNELLKVLNLIAQRPLTPKHREIMAFALSTPLDTKHPLRGQFRRQVKELLSMSEQTLAMHISEMKLRGWLDANSIPQGMLMAIRQKVKDTGQFIIGMPYIIKIDGEDRSQRDS